MAKGKGGFIGQDGLNAPDQATGVSASGGDGQVTVSFTAPSDVGGAAITGYSVVSNTGATALSGSITASYDSKSFNVSSQAGGAGGVQFKSDGTKMYVTGQTSDKTFQYSLSTPYDVSTASYDSVELNHATQVSNANPYDLFFKTDGTKLYVMFGINDTVYQYSLSTAWNLATASYDNVNFSVASQESGEPGGLAFSDDGSKMYVCGEGQATVFQYTLSTPWNLSTASYASKSFDVSSQGTKPAGLAFAKDGKLMLVVDEGAVKVFLYLLTTPFDVSTATYTSSSFSVSSQDPRPWYVALANNNTKMYVGGPNNDTVYQYTVDLSVGYPTASPVTVTGLTNGTSYTFNVWAINPFGWSSPSDASAGVTPNNPFLGDTAYFFGGNTQSGYSDVIQFTAISTLGNASEFGDLATILTRMGACSSTTRGLSTGGFSGSNLNTIQYITLNTKGNTTDFGDLAAVNRFNAALSSNTRGVVGGGQSGTGTTYNVIQYVTIASTGNATDFGDLTSSRWGLASCASTTRGVFAGGDSNSNVIDYITTASTGNATDFGNLTAGAYGLGGASNATRGVFAGGSARGGDDKTIDYITIASTGNATDFGDLDEGGVGVSAAANSTRCLFGSGVVSYDKIEYVTIASTGNAAVFGDLLSNGGREHAAGCSDSHGGLS